jgi:hypothetical protein
MQQSKKNSVQNDGEYKKNMLQFSIFVAYHIQES